MTYSSLPLEIPIEIGNKISEIVKEFAGETGIEATVWYHNEPLWFVSKEEGTLMKRVQIAVFETKSGRELRMIPTASIAEAGSGKMRTRKSIPPKEIQHLSYRDLENLYFTYPDDFEMKIRNKLAEAWEFAERLEETDLEENYDTRRPLIA